MAGLFAGIGMAALRFRKRLNRSGALLALTLACLGGLAGTVTLTGCIAHGGLVMTPGTYQYVVQAFPRGGGASATTTIQVTVQGS
jgi:hypothetical protein